MMCCLAEVYFNFIIYAIFICHTLGSDTANTNPCEKIRDQFAIAASNFTSCSIKNSRPITLCNSCVDSYINLLGSYRNMSKISTNGTTCLDHFVNLDRLQIVETQYLNSINLWDRGKCNECYEIENGSPTRNTSTITKTFLKYYDSFTQCTNNTDSKNLCDNCMDDYVVLHDYYFSISNSNERISLCIDLVDIMNTTWTYWSVNCCTYRKHNEYIFIGSTVSVFLITISYYIIVQFCAEKKVPTIIQQTRFAESVSPRN